MKNLLLITLSVLATSCLTPSDKNFTLRVCSGSGLLYSETWVECDSFQMVSSNEAFIWLNGTKMKVIGDKGIKPSSN